MQRGGKAGGFRQMIRRTVPPWVPTPLVGGGVNKLLCAKTKKVGVSNCIFYFPL